MRVVIQRRRGWNWATASLLLAAATTRLIACGADDGQAGARSGSSSTQGQTTETSPPGIDVVKIIDGDTIDVRGSDDSVDRVRFIGINAPESDECFSADATAALTRLLGDGALSLISDRTDRDQYGRLLRYVEVDGVDVGLALIEGGDAIARRYPPDTARADRYEAAQDAARRAGTGLWAPDACGASDDHPDIVIDAVQFDAAGDDTTNLNDEWVRIANTESVPVDLTGWMLRDESSSHRYEFPDGFVLIAHASVTVHSGCGTDTGDDLFWCVSGSAVWNNSGDTAFILGPEGNVVASQRG